LGEKIKNYEGSGTWGVHEYKKHFSGEKGFGNVA